LDFLDKSFATNRNGFGPAWLARIHAFAQRFFNPLAMSYLKTCDVVKAA